jgi:hypothetical protein rflaF_02915
MNRRAVEHPFQHAHLSNLKCAAAVDLKGAALSLCSLGGGNHFIEVDRGEDGTNYLLIHTGSRHLGVEVCKYYQSLAISSLKKNDARAIINELKAAGRASEIQSTLAALKPDAVPADLAYLEGENLANYLHDMAIVQEYATWNRFAIATEIMAHLGIATAEIFSSVHNYIDTEEMILRKGAISAAKGKKLVIPLSMADGAIIGLGKGHPAWNCSAPHGAGRQMSRAKAKSSLSLESFAATMSGIYTTSVCADTWTKHLPHTSPPHPSSKTLRIRLKSSKLSNPSTISKPTKKRIYMILFFSKKFFVIIFLESEERENEV